jgi:hypothetical protein
VKTNTLSAVALRAATSHHTESERAAKMKNRCTDGARQLGPAEEVWFTVEFHDIPSGTMLTRMTMNGETLVEFPGGLNAVEKEMFAKLLLVHMGVTPTGPGHVDIFQRGGSGGNRRRGPVRR